VSRVCLHRIRPLSAVVVGWMSDCGLLTLTKSGGMCAHPACSRQMDSVFVTGFSGVCSFANLEALPAVVFWP